MFNLRFQSPFWFVIFLTNKCLDLISIHHLRAMTRCHVEFNFLPTISLDWAPIGVLGYDFLPRGKKCFDTIPRTQKNLEFVKNTGNSPKYGILSSILFLVFTVTVCPGQDYPCTTATLMFDCFKKKLHSGLLQHKV